MSNLARILKREMSEECTRFGRRKASRRMPSTRNRTIESLRVGSMWMSLDRARTASVMIMFPSRTMGARRVSSSRVWISASVGWSVSERTSNNSSLDSSVLSPVMRSIAASISGLT